MVTSEQKFVVAAFGSVDFCRRMNSIVLSRRLPITFHSGAFPEAWSLILAHRPNLALIEVGLRHSDRTQGWLKNFLIQVRERLGGTVSIGICLQASENLINGGELLFESDDNLNPSKLVDTFIVAPPPMAPSIPSIPEQVENAILLFSHEHSRRAEGKVPLPPLNDPGWVQSLADPLSRELWMRWLPRYATYTNENPIIIGETGTGKTNLAYALHLLSGREGQFIGITPRDFSSSELVQAELFGAVSGAYTGAVDKWGLVKSAERGSLFIDELQSIDKDLQGKLITFIENKAYRRVGSAERTEADVRFLFASNRTLSDMMDNDVLRNDFAYRLERVQLELPPLRRRRLDITAALAYALAKIRRQRPQARAISGFTSGAYRLLFSYSWPGNLRQLENTVAQLCERADMKGLSLVDEEVVTQHFEARLSSTPTSPSEVISQAAYRYSLSVLSSNPDSLEKGVERFEDMIRSVGLESCGGDVEKAAELMKDDPTALSLFAQCIEAKHYR